MPCFKATFPANICNCVESFIVRNSSLRTPGKISTVSKLSPGCCGADEVGGADTCEKETAGFIINPAINKQKNSVTYRISDLLRNTVFYRWRS